MDFNHDYVEHEPFLVAGARERLQMCKCAILSKGDLGYTDPAIPDLREAIGQYTDAEACAALESLIQAILEIGQFASRDEIISITVTAHGDTFTAALAFTFGTEVFDVPAIL